MSFEFVDYNFDRKSGKAEFRYRNDDADFVERVYFVTADAVEFDEKVMDGALFLAFVVLGTSYYKVQAGREVKLANTINIEQARIFDAIYQEGLGQFAFENNLTRDDLAHFDGVIDDRMMAGRTTVRDESLALVSGGKDSLLAVEMLREAEKKIRVAYITAQENYPEIIDEVSGESEPIIIRREIDKEALRRAGGMNGHVPVTIINEALALVQAIILGCDKIVLGIGAEGLEPHTYIGDLPVNHQWAKTMEAQGLMQIYLEKYVTPDIKLTSPLQGDNELTIARKFAEKCWAKYGDKFSSCNVANYKQGVDNRELKWCGKCAKCANSYLLFAPFVPFEGQYAIFGRDLFTDADLVEIYKGLLGVDGVMKPFECVASIDELRQAYRDRLNGYGDLPFEV